MRQKLAAKQMAAGGAPSEQKTLDPPTATIRRQVEQNNVDEKEQRVYLGWINWKLTGVEGAKHMVNLIDDLQDGVALCQLAQVLLKVKLRFNANATLPPQQMDNCSVALKAFGAVGITGDARTFVGKDKRAILGFLWQLVEKETTSKREFSMKSGADIYDWVAEYLSSYPAVPADVRVLGARAFRDGRLLAMMVHRAAGPDVIDLSAVETQSPLTRLLEAVRLARTRCGVPSLVSAELMMDAGAPERAIMTYLLSFRECIENGVPQKIAKEQNLVPKKDQKEKGKFGTMRGAPKQDNRAGLEVMQAGPQHAGLSCPTCKKALQSGGTLVKVLPEEILYHSACFCCRTCKKAFDQYYWPYQLIPYCFDHYLQAAGMTCNSCNKTITENAVIARSKRYHSSCFTCSTCGVEFGGSYNIFDGKPFCDEHYKDVAGVTCTKCGLDIDDQAIKAMSGLWHLACFSCQRCGVQILQPNSKPLPFFAMEAQPICVDCHEQMVDYHPDTCSTCKKPISSDCVSALGSKFHSSCFVCTKCRKPFKESFYNVDGKPYDEACARML